RQTGLRHVTHAPGDAFPLQPSFIWVGRGCYTFAARTVGWTRYEGEKSGEEKSRRAVAGVPVAAALLRFIADFLDEHGWILAVRANGERNAQNWQSTDSQGAV